MLHISTALKRDAFSASFCIPYVQLFPYMTVKNAHLPARGNKLEFKLMTNYLIGLIYRKSVPYVTKIQILPILTLYGKWIRNRGLFIRWYVGCPCSYI